MNSNLVYRSVTLMVRARSQGLQFPQCTVTGELMVSDILITIIEINN